MSKKVRGHYWRDKNGKLVWVPTYYRKARTKDATTRLPTQPKGGDAKAKRNVP